MWINCPFHVAVQFDDAHARALGKCCDTINVGPAACNRETNMHCHGYVREAQRPQRITSCHHQRCSRHAQTYAKDDACDHQAKIPQKHGGDARLTKRLDDNCLRLHHCRLSLAPRHRSAGRQIRSPWAHRHNQERGVFPRNGITHLQPLFTLATQRTKPGPPEETHSSSRTCCWRCKQARWWHHAMMIMERRYV